jgi:hypothetical protein
MQLQNESARGLSRLLERVSGPRAQLTDLRCDAESDAQGANRYWRNCSMVVGGTEPARRLRVFGQILERDGRFKFVAYNTDF